MKKQKMYRYLGRNGIITSQVELINVDYLEMIKLIATTGHLLTNGEKEVYEITVFPEEVEQWSEIKNPHAIIAEASDN